MYHLSYSTCCSPPKKTEVFVRSSVDVMRLIIILLEWVFLSLLAARTLPELPGFQRLLGLLLW